MLMIPGNVKIYLYTKPTDMRKSFSGLSGLAYEAFHNEASDGNLYVFVNRRGDRMKILYWDVSGFALWYKFLEVGKFHLPKPSDTATVSNAELALILEGLEAKELKRRPRYQRPVS